MALPSVNVDIVFAILVIFDSIFMYLLIMKTFIHLYKVA